MIVVDSSALLAILFQEPEQQSFEAVLLSGERCVISAVNAHETACVLRRRFDQEAAARIWRLLAIYDIAVVPFDAAQARAAAEAFHRYGKGIDPKARLNLCDCAAYALARIMNAPLLFKGNDFPETDIRSAA